MDISPLRSYAGKLKREILYRLYFANNLRCARLAINYESDSPGSSVENQCHRPFALGQDTLLG